MKNQWFLGIFFVVLALPSKSNGTGEPSPLAGRLASLRRSIELYHFVDDAFKELSAIAEPPNENEWAQGVAAAAGVNILTASQAVAAYPRIAAILGKSGLTLGRPPKSDEVDAILAILVAPTDPPLDTISDSPARAPLRIPNIQLSAQRILVCEGGVVLPGPNGSLICTGTWVEKEVGPSQTASPAF